MLDQTESEENRAAFRDCVFEVTTSKLTATTKTSNRRYSKAKGRPSKQQFDESKPPGREFDNDPSDLAEFSVYIADAIFHSLPSDLKSLSHQVLLDNQDIAEKWSLPLTLTVFEELADVMEPSVADSLVAYGLVQPPESDVQSFISPIVTHYISIVTIPPLPWIATRTAACEICDRDWIPLTYHHLIPREVHSKVLKRGWHEEHMLNSVAWLCRACHSFVHRMASNEELAKDWFTVDLICSREDVQKWAQWVGRVRWKKA